MSDFVEKILMQEQDTDKKFVAAAEFFVNLKGKDKEAAYAAPAKTKKPKQLAIEESKRVVTSGGATPIPLTAAPNRAASSEPGQAKPSSDKKPMKYKKVERVAKLDKPKITRPKKVKKFKPRFKQASAEVALQRLVDARMDKEASAGVAGRGIYDVISQALKGGTKALSNTASAAQNSNKMFREGYNATPGNAFTNAWKNLVSRGPSPEVGFNAGRLANMPGAGVGRAVRDVFRTPDLVKKERLYRTRQADFLKKQRAEKPGGGLHEMVGGTEAQIQANLRNMQKQQAKNLQQFRTGMGARSMTGIPETSSNVLKQMQGQDGSYSMGSIMKGADDLGLFNPATLAAMGLSAKGSIDAARAARAAAQKDKMMKWGLGGAAGLGTLALLKNSGSKQSS